MTTEETLSMHANRITRGASIMRQPFKPWERLKALDDIEVAVLAARRILMPMNATEREMAYWLGSDRNGRREME